MHEARHSENEFLCRVFKLHSTQCSKAQRIRDLHFNYYLSLDERNERFLANLVHTLKGRTQTQWELYSFFCSHEQSFSLHIQMSNSNKIKRNRRRKKNETQQIDRQKSYAFVSLQFISIAICNIYLRSLIWKSVICRMQFIRGVWFVGHVNVASLWCASYQRGKWSAMLSKHVDFEKKQHFYRSNCIRESLTAIQSETKHKKKKKSKRKIVAEHWTRSNVA